MNVNFVVRVEPLPQPRPRFSRGRCYQPARIVEYKKAVAQAARLAMKDKTTDDGRIVGSVQVVSKI